MAARQRAGCRQRCVPGGDAQQRLELRLGTGGAAFDEDRRRSETGAHLRTHIVGDTADVGEAGPGSGRHLRPAGFDGHPDVCVGGKLTAAKRGDSEQKVAALRGPDRDSLVPDQRTSRVAPIDRRLRAIDVRFRLGRLPGLVGSGLAGVCPDEGAPPKTSAIVMALVSRLSMNPFTAPSDCTGAWHRQIGRLPLGRGAVAGKAGQS